MIALREGRWRILVVLPLFAAAVALIIWHGPDWSTVENAFTLVRWEWVAAAIGLNLLSVVARAGSWNTTIKQSIARPHPRFALVFSAFCVGLFANAVLPGRVGELARVAVLNRRMRQPGGWARLLGTVFAHRVFDLVAVIALVIYVVLTAHIPDWAVTSLIGVVAA